MNHTLVFDKIVPEGRALARTADGLVVFCDGVLPGETAEVEIVRQKKTYAEARLVAVTKPSKHRHPATEEHYLSCSPWQSVDYSYQLELKSGIIRDAFAQQKVSLPEFTVTASPTQAGYRNKLEFVFTGHPGSLELALHQRGSRDDVVSATQGCVLGTPAMNQAVAQVVEALNAQRVATVARLIVRADQAGHILIILVALPHFSLNWATVELPVDNVVVCTPAERGDGLGKVLYSKGHTSLADTLAGVRLSYDYNSFFQINPAAFMLALSAIVQAVPSGKRIVELYGGVGSIGLALAGTATSVIGVESVKSAASAATLNAKANKITNYSSHLGAAEAVEQTILTAADVLIVDPPRAGLHTGLVETIKASGPEQLVYLSCNPVTQARDLALLADSYQLGAYSAYDFYPGTPHVESLAILRRSPAPQPQ